MQQHHIVHVSVLVVMCAPTAKCSEQRSPRWVGWRKLPPGELGCRVLLRVPFLFTGCEIASSPF